MANNFLLIYILLGIVIALVLIFGIINWQEEEEEEKDRATMLEKLDKLTNGPLTTSSSQININFDNSTYPLNSTATVTVTDPNYASNPGLFYTHNGRPSIIVNVASTSDTTGIVLQLVQKTTGSTTFVTAPYKVVMTNLPSDNSTKWLKASVGDIVSATYEGKTTSATITPPLPVKHGHVGVSTSNLLYPYGDSLFQVSNLQKIVFPIDRSTVPSCISNNLNDGICDDWTDGTWGGQPGQLAIPYGSLLYTYCDPSNPTSSYGVPDCPDPSRQNIYVEIDYMSKDPSGSGYISQRPSDAALTAVAQAFANHNMALHIQLDNDMAEPNSYIYFDKTTVPGSVTDTNTNSFFGIKNSFFGTDSERTCPSPIPDGYTDCISYVHDLLSAKRQAFHYALFMHSQASNAGSSGWGEYLGNDMIVSLGSFPSGSTAVLNGAGTDTQVEAALMHELGHNLNLDHGGPININNPLPYLGTTTSDSSINCKPNYISTMNYAYQAMMLSWVNPWQSVYSSNIYGSLNERSGLSEPAGIGAVMNPNTVLWGWGGTAGSGPATTSQPLDWDLNHNTADTGVVGSVRNLGGSISDCADTTPRAYSSYNDWNNLYLIFYNSVNFATGESSNAVASHQEITSDEVAKLVSSLYCRNGEPIASTAQNLTEALSGAQYCTSH